MSGTTPRSVQALRAIKRICEAHLAGRYDLEVVDVYQHPRRADEEQIVALPTLLRVLPPPLRKFIGDLSDTEKVLVGLNVSPAPLRGEVARREEPP